MACGNSVGCSGEDFETHYPRHFAASGLTRCKLQMMRTFGAAQWMAAGSFARGRAHPALLSGVPGLYYASLLLAGALRKRRRSMTVGESTDWFRKPPTEHSHSATPTNTAWPSISSTKKK